MFVEDVDDNLPSTIKFGSKGDTDDNTKTSKSTPDNKYLVTSTFRSPSSNNETHDFENFDKPVWGSAARRDC